MLSSPSKCQLIESFGQNQSLGSENIDNVKEFIRTVVYSGKVDETYVETRIRLYKEMKSKSSSSIPPDPDSVEQAIKRANYQVFHWVRCCEVTIETVSFEDHGWKWDEEKRVVVPIWFKGKQLPPSLLTRRKKIAKNLNYDNDGDAEMSDDEIKGQKRTSTKRKHYQRDVLPITHMDYDGDSEMTRDEIIDGSDTSRSDEHESE